MTTTKKFWYYAFALVGATFMLFSSCEKDDDQQSIPILSTTEITEITQTTATSGGNITDDGGATVTARGVCWSTSQNPTISGSKTEDGTGTGNFTSSIFGLEPNTMYYVRAYATNSEGTGYGDALSFTTLEDLSIPILSTTEITEITQTTATSGGNITDDGGATVTARGVCWSTSQNPTISGSKTEDGTGTGNFTSSISGLEPNTMYYVRAYATNSEGTGYGDALSFTTLKEVTGVVDADGNVYSTVVIGNQEWFAENLKTTHYNDGTPIPNVSDNTEWSTLTTDAYAWYENDEATYKNAYGALYNWYAVNTGKLCPTGWHVPTDAEEWATLVDYAGGDVVAGGKLKSTRTAPAAHPRWESPNAGATDEYGFSALPGGRRYDNDGHFDNVGSIGFWWSSTENDAASAWYRNINYDWEYVGFNSSRDKKRGFSVRCLRDN